MMQHRAALWTVEAQLTITGAHNVCAIAVTVTAPAGVQRVQLGAYDTAGAGELNLEELQRFIADAASLAPLLAGMEVCDGGQMT